MTSGSRELSARTRLVDANVATPTEAAMKERRFIGSELRRYGDTEIRSDLGGECYCDQGQT